MVRRELHGQAVAAYQKVGSRHEGQQVSGEVIPVGDRADRNTDFLAAGTE